MYTYRSIKQKALNALFILRYLINNGLERDYYSEAKQ